MKNIRNGIFETNSSSSHSITICKVTNGIYDDTILPGENGIIVLTGGRFGWEWREYNDALTKANYCAIDVCGSEHYREDSYREDDGYPIGNPKCVEMLKKVIEEFTGGTVVFSLDGYIDHQSKGTSLEAFKSEETLKNFLFCSSSELYTRNDNE